MRVRAAHLACVMLLLSTFGAADAQVFARGDFARHGQPVGIILQQGVPSPSEEAFPRAVPDVSASALPGAPVAHTRPAWSMRPPAAHTVQQHAATGSGL